MDWAMASAATADAARPVPATLRNARRFIGLFLRALRTPSPPSQRRRHFSKATLSAQATPRKRKRLRLNGERDIPSRTVGMDPRPCRRARNDVVALVFQASTTILGAARPPALS